MYRGIHYYAVPLLPCLLTVPQLIKMLEEEREGGEYKIGD